MQNFTVIVTGSLGFDFIMNFSGTFKERIMMDKVHSISLSFLADKLNKQFGGTAGNVGYSLKLLETEPILVAPVGNDFGLYQQFLSRHSIDTRGIKEFPKESSGTYFVVTDKEDNQIGAYYKGALKYAHTLSLTQFFPRADFVMLSPTEVSAMNGYVHECVKAGKRYMFDPAFNIGDFTKDDLTYAIEHAAILIGNDYEIALIEQKLEISHEELFSTVPILVTTLGNKGSIIETDRENIHIQAAKPKKVSDPTGAGDAYRAGFLAGYVRGFDLVTCGQLGSVAAVYTVEKYGTVTHSYTKDEFIERFEQSYGRKITF